jgi:hypothetical protein
MEITVLYFVDVIPYVFLSLVLAMAANRFASMSDEELQAFLEDRRSSKTYKKQTNKHICIQTQQFHFIY